jgi:hypothetical protein
MPYSKCPVCGAIAHLSVGDVRRWYAEYYPGVPVGALVPGKRFYCWAELQPEMRGVIRQALGGEAAAPAGSHGVVQRVLSSPEHGNIYLVRLGSGEERYFIRAELGEAREGDAKPGAAADGVEIEVHSSSSPRRC